MENEKYYCIVGKYYCIVCGAEVDEGTMFCGNCRDKYDYDFENNKIIKLWQEKIEQRINHR